MKQKEPRLIDPGYLTWLRKRPCCVCGSTPCDAAHIRFGSEFYGKRNVGMAEKPDDKWAVSLCRKCHMEQHGMNEQEYWRSKRILVLALAQKLYTEYGGTGGHVRQKRKRTVFKPRLDEPKRKITSRPFSTQKRYFPKRKRLP